MDRLITDFRVAARRLRRSPAFTASALLILVLAIGANTTIFTIVNRVVLKPLPALNPQDLVFLNFKWREPSINQSYLDYRDFRDRNDVLSGLAAYRPAPVSVNRGGTGLRTWGFLVTGNYFQTLGVRAALGRPLLPEDDLFAGSHPVATLTYAAWQTRFGGDPAVIGSNVKLNGLDYTIVGVMPEGFYGTERLFTPDLFVPMMMASRIEPGSNWMEYRGARNIFVLGRLKPGVTRELAETGLNAVAAQIAREHPNLDSGMQVSLSEPGLFGNEMRGPLVGGSAVLLLVAAAVLLIACSNLAGLLLARASDRQSDFALRLAVGATRGALVRQQIIESLLLSLVGGAAGIMLALWLTAAIHAWAPLFEVPLLPRFDPDAWSLSFAVLISMATGVVAGIAPALKSARVDLVSAMRQDRVFSHARVFNTRDLLVAAQVSLCVVLLVGALLAVRSLRYMERLDVGFNPDGAAMLAVDLQIEGYNRARADAFGKRVLESVRSTPGIQSAALAGYLPLGPDQGRSAVFIDGAPPVSVAQAPEAAEYRAGPGFFETMQTRVVAGREFSEADAVRGRAAIVNETFVRRLLPGRDPIAARFRFGGQPREIVGVVEDGKYHYLYDDPMPVVFLPAWEEIGHTTLVARSELPAAQVLNSMRTAVREVDSSLSIFNDHPLRDHLELPLLPGRALAILVGSLGGLAILLAAAGVYGIVAYSVARRTREIGIRVALGAAPVAVVRTVVKRAVTLVAAGATLGLAGGWALGSIFAQVMYGANPRDPLTFGLALSMMLLVTVLACFVPAQRAVRVDPVTALRSD